MVFIPTNTKKLYHNDMIKKKAINSIRDTLIGVYHPLKIYLFGSYAWGSPNDESDLDILIIVSRSNKEFYERAIKGYHALRDSTISKDILVLTKKRI